MGSFGQEHTATFSDEEVAQLESQSFCKSVGRFTASQYKVSCYLGIQGTSSFGTEMFFESVPDAYIDCDQSRWNFNPEQPLIPIILPRTYLAIYNFGFAQSQSLPKISEHVATMVDMTVRLRGKGIEETLPAKVVGFSSRLNTILVPETFITWSNQRYAPDSDTAPSRLLLEVYNPTDDTIVSYLQDHSLELEDNRLDAGKATYFLKLTSGIVIAVGLLISILSFFVLMLSIYLLVQKNTEKLRNLLLIGYTPIQVALPYQLLTIGMNLTVLFFVLICVWISRMCYSQMIWAMFPQIPEGEFFFTVCVGVAISVLVSLLNVLAIRNKIINIWKHKD